VMAELRHRKNLTVELNSLTHTLLHAPTSIRIEAIMSMLPPGLQVQHAEVAARGGSDDWCSYEGEAKFENVMIVDEDRNKVCSSQGYSFETSADCSLRYCWATRRRGLVRATTVRLQAPSPTEKTE
jgi:hypothetical protein